MPAEFEPRKTSGIEFGQISEKESTHDTHREQPISPIHYQLTLSGSEEARLADRSVESINGYDPGRTLVTRRRSLRLQSS